MGICWNNSLLALWPPSARWFCRQGSFIYFPILCWCSSDVVTPWRSHWRFLYLCRWLAYHVAWFQGTWLGFVFGPVLGQLEPLGFLGSWRSSILYSALTLAVMTLAMIFSVTQSKLMSSSFAMVLLRFENLLCSLRRGVPTLSRESSQTHLSC